MDDNAPEPDLQKHIVKYILDIFFGFGVRDVMNDEKHAFWSYLGCWMLKTHVWGFHLGSYRFSNFPKHSLASRRGSHGVDKEPLSCRWQRPRCEWAFETINNNEFETDLQKHINELQILRSFAIWRESGDDLWERCLLELPGLLDARCVRPGCLLGDFWLPSGFARKSIKKIVWRFELGSLFNDVYKLS